MSKTFLKTNKCFWAEPNNPMAPHIPTVYSEYIRKYAPQEPKHTCMA